MNDLSVFETAWRSSTRVSAKVQYQRVWAAGGEWTRVCLKEGRVSDYELGSNLRVEALRTSKKGKNFLTKKAVFGDFSSLDKLSADSDYLFETVPSSDDPRLYSESVPSDEDTSWRASYDAELARALPALVFHRLWQSAKDPLSRGVLFDAQITWLSGRIAWNGAPLPWAWADSKNVFYAPETRIDEAFSFYSADAPSRKCRFRHSVRRVDPAQGLDEFADRASQLASLPTCAMVPQNVDAVILAPGAVSQLLKLVLPAFAANAPALDAFARLYGASGNDLCLHPSLDLSCDPTYDAFGFKVLPLDARGKRTQPVQLVKKGVLSGLVASDTDAQNIRPFASEAALPRLSELIRSLKPNGHALDTHGQSAVFYPVLKGNDDLPAYNSDLPGLVAQRTLVVDTIRCVTPADSSLPSFIYMPEGACLFENGIPVGQTPPHRIVMTLAELLTHAQAASTPAFCDGMAVCAVALDPSLLFQNV